MHPDLGDLILDRMHHIVQFEKNIHFDDTVTKRVQFAELLLNVVNEFDVGVEMHCLNVYVHGVIFYSETINKELLSFAGDSEKSFCYKLVQKRETYQQNFAKTGLPPGSGPGVRTGVDIL